MNNSNKPKHTPGPWRHEHEFEPIVDSDTVREMLKALEQAHNDIIRLLIYGNFNRANFNTASISCVDGRVELNLGYLVEAIDKAKGYAK